MINDVSKPGVAQSLDLSLFEATPGMRVIYLPDAPRFTIIAATKDICKHLGFPKNHLVGKGVFEVFPSNPDDPSDTGEKNLRESLAHVLQHKEPHQLPVQRYDVKEENDRFTRRYWKAANFPFLNDEGEVVYIIHTTEDITDQVEAGQREEAHQQLETAYLRLKESEDKYHSLFESMDQGFCVLEMIFDAADQPVDYRFLEVNPVFKYQTGLKDAVGKTARELVPNLEQHWFERYGNVALTGEPIRFTEGSEAMGRWFEVYAFRIGEAVSRKVALLFTDITERRKSEEALRQSEERLKKVLSIETVGVIYFDLNGGIHDANAAFQRISGYSRADLESGRVRWDQLTPQEFIQATLHSREEFLTRGQNTPYEKQYIRPDGSRWWGLFAGKRLSENECVEFVVDITEQKKAQEALRESESNLRNMILQSPIAMAILKGPDHVVEIANSRMFELWGRGPDELLNRSIFEGLPEVKDQGYEDLLNGVYTTGKTFTANGIPVTLPRNGNIETVFINLLYEAFREGDGAITGIMAVASDVTEQVLARMKVEKSHQELQFMMDAMPQLVWITKPDGYHDVYNQKWYEYTGLSYEETKGTGWNSVVHPDHQEHAWAVWRHSLTTGEPYQIEYCLKRYDGVYRWFLGRALPLRDESGVILKWFGTCTDIDDQKKAAELLEQSEARTRLAVEAANLGTFEINVAAQTIIHSPRTAEIIGLDPAVQWPYQSFLNSLYPEDKAVREKAHENARRTGNLYYEARVILPDKTIRWIRINGVLIDKDSTSILIGTKKDITEEKRAAELLEQKIEERTRELEAQKSLLNNILTNSSNGISVTEMIRDESGNVVDARTILANDAAVNYIGLPREMFLSKTAVELDPNILSSDYGQICLNTLRTGEPALSQYYMEATGRWQELTISKMDDDHLIHIFTDVTPIKEAQLQLERTVEELRRSNRNLEEFAYAASHDLKEPIRKIYFFTNQLKDQLSNRLAEGEERSLSRIENASQRMGNLVDDLLIYSHVSQQPHEKESVDLNEKIQRVLEDLELDIKEKKANIHVGNLPTVGGYRRQLQQLFQNLISNALKYSKRNIPPLIDITACQVRENNKLYHRIEVKDNGIGFEQQYADKIFQMFTRLHGKAEYSGTGVGLSIVKKVVENHNGNIRVESTLGQGSTFTVLLPAE